jgi:hypothetical protein
MNQSEPMQVHGIRFSAALIERMDRHVKRLQAESPGVTLTRSDAIRSMLLQALDAAEEASAEQRKQRR